MHRETTRQELSGSACPRGRNSPIVIGDWHCGSGVAGTMLCMDQQKGTRCWPFPNVGGDGTSCWATGCPIWPFSPCRWGWSLRGA